MSLNVLSLPIFLPFYGCSERLDATNVYCLTTWVSSLCGLLSPSGSFQCLEHPRCHSRWQNFQSYEALDPILCVSISLQKYVPLKKIVDSNVINWTAVGKETWQNIFFSSWIKSSLTECYLLITSHCQLEVTKIEPSCRPNLKLYSWRPACYYAPAAPNRQISVLKSCMFACI